MIPCPKCQAPCLDSHRYCPACGADLSSSEALSDDRSLIGTTIAGKFILRELIGSGGMGKVFRADQKGVGRTVAVKIMHRHLLGDETASARFTNEARASSTLNHPNSIAVLDFGQTEVGMLYIVMEYLRGRPLDVVVRDEFPLPLGRVVAMMCQALDAVEAAHELSIIHRDLKPENVFLLSDQPAGWDCVKVLDFGIAKMLDLEDRSVTTPGLVPGTPEYMSPEQARGEQLDPRSDVYSLGVILYELLTSTVPFRGSSAVATMMSHVQDPVPPPSARCPGVAIPSSLESIVLWALAKDPMERISSAAQFAEVLSAWAKVAGVWLPAEDRKASPAVLLDVLSEEQVTGIRRQVVAEGSFPTPAPSKVTDVQPVARVVGRLLEMETLRRFLAASGPRAIRIEGDVGTGKSRLITEMVQWGRDAGYEVLRASPEDGWAGNLLHTAQQIALRCLGVDMQGYDAAAVLQASSALGIDADEVPGIHELFVLPSHLAEFGVATRRRERATAFRQLVIKSAQRSKLLVVVEQFDRADAASQELIKDLVKALEGDVAVVVITSDQTDSWPEGMEAMAVPPLSSDESIAMAQEMFSDAPDRQLLERIAEAAGGHALFIQQLVHAVAREGVTEPPERLGDLIAARLQRLDVQRRTVLQWASVFHCRVSAETLAEAMGHDVSEEDLGTLADAGLLTRVPINKATVRTQQLYHFSHHLLAVVVYSSIPAEVRREMHHTVAAYLRREDGAVTLTAYHAYEADDGPNAVDELERAGEWASRCLVAEEAIQQYTRALNLVRREWGRGRVGAAELDAMAVKLALRLAAELRQTDDLVTAEGVLAEVLSVAAGSGHERAKLRLELGRLDLERGNIQRALRHLQLARADAESTGVSEVSADILQELARAHGLDGDNEEAGRLLFTALEQSGRLGRKGPGWAALVSTANTSTQIGFPERARGYLFDALQQAEEQHSYVGKTKTLERMVALHLAHSEWQEAELRITQGIELSVQVGDRMRRVDLLVTLGRVRRIKGDAEGAREFLDKAMQLCRHIDWDEGLQSIEQESELLRFAAPQAL